MKNIGRREFISYSLAAAGMLLLTRFIKPARASNRVEGTSSERSDTTSVKSIEGFGTVPDNNKRYAMVIDIGACIGCRKCAWACKEENNIPDSISPPWIEIFEMESESGVPERPLPGQRGNTSYTEAPKEGKYYLPVHCNHCANPPCVKVCPTGATFQDEDGMVLMNYERCIGCRLCVIACPYNARRFNLFKPEEITTLNPLVPVHQIGVTEKCSFCVHRVRRGKLPRCVEVCPVQAKHFGDLNDTKSSIYNLIKTNPNFKLVEESNTDPQIWYITRGKKWI